MPGLNFPFFFLFTIGLVWVKSLSFPTCMGDQVITHLHHCSHGMHLLSSYSDGCVLLVPIKLHHLDSTTHYIINLASDFQFFFVKKYFVLGWRVIVCIEQNWDYVTAYITLCFFVFWCFLVIGGALVRGISGGERKRVYWQWKSYSAHHFCSLINQLLVLIQQLHFGLFRCYRTH